MSSRRRISTSAPTRWRSRPVSQSFGRLTIQCGNASPRFPNVASILSVCSSDKFPSRSVRETPARSVTASDIRIPTPGMAVSEIATGRVPSRSVFAMRTMYRKSSFTPSSFLGPRGALGSSFSSSFFFPPRSALSAFAGTGGPSGSGLGFSSGIDEIPGWDGHPNFRTYLRIRGASPEVWILEDESDVVHEDLDGISGRKIFEPIPPFRDSGVPLKGRLDPQIGKSDPRDLDLPLFPYGRIETADGQGVRCGGDLEVDVDATLQIALLLAIQDPAAILRDEERKPASCPALLDRHPRGLGPPGPITSHAVPNPGARLEATPSRRASGSTNRSVSSAYGAGSKESVTRRLAKPAIRSPTSATMTVSWVAAWRRRPATDVSVTRPPK